MSDLSAFRRDARRLFERGVEAANPRVVLEQRASLRSDGLHYDGRLSLASPGVGGQWVIVGAGKAAAHLASSMEHVLDGQELTGRVIVKDGHSVELERVVSEEASHPVPDDRGQAATRRLRAQVEGLSSSDRALLLLTGGASSLLVAPASGVTLEDKVATTRLLLASGADIHELNAVRKHLSGVKGGILGRQLVGKHSLALVVSDVVGDELSSIGSGPAVPDPTTFDDCWEILERYRLLDSLPASVRSRLASGRRGLIEETPKPSPSYPKIPHVILASNRQSIDAVCDMARDLGYRPEVFASDMTGDVHRTAVAFAERLRAGGRERFALIAGGELTLQLSGNGKGGRSQEFALVAANTLSSANGVVLLAAGTDGTDGPTDAAGAIADCVTWERAKTKGLSPEAVLANNDSYTLFSALSDLVITGPTGTNVMDLMIGLSGG